MPRIRTIKPEFWEDEKVASLQHGAQLLFIALWNLADDEGRLRGGTALIHRKVFPYEAEAPVGAWLDDLVTKGFVRRYVIDGQTYLHVTNFLRHQRIKKPSPSKLPTPTDTPLVPPEFPTPPPRVPPGTGKGTGKGKELGTVKEPASPASEELMRPQELDNLDGANKPRSGGPNVAFVAWFRARHLELTKQPLDVAWSRDATLAASLLATFGEVELKRRAEALLRMPHKTFQTSNGKTIPALKQHVNSLGGTNHVAEPNKFDGIGETVSNSKKSPGYGL